MAQLWGGRFTKETDKLVYNFNASISFDQKFYEQDIRGSKAHVKMLAKQGILTEEERDKILEGLEGILADVKAGRLAITSEYEDIHSFVEANLIYFSGIFQRTDRKRSCKIIVASLFCQSGCLFHTKAVAPKTPLAPFRHILKPLRHLIEILWLILPFHQGHRMKKLHLADQPADLCYPFFVFLFRGNVGIIKKHCNRKKPGKIFQDVTAAGCAAGVKEKSGDSSRLLLPFN